MKQKGKRVLVSGACLVLCTGMLSGCTKKIAADDVVLTVDDSTMNAGTASTFLRYSQVETASYMSYYFGNDFWNTDMGDGTTYGETFKDGILDSLEKMLVQEDHMADYDVTITDEEKAKITQAASDFLAANDEKTRNAVMANQENVERMLTLDTVQSKMRAEIIKDVDTNVTDDEAKQTTISYVLFSTADTTDDEGNTTALTDEEKTAMKDEAQQVLLGMDNGSTMEDALAEINPDLTVSSKTFGADDTTLDDAIKTAIEGLQDGEYVKDIVETDSGYYVVQVTDEFDEDATATKKEEIISQRESDLYDETVSGWLEDAKITVKDKVWNALTLFDHYLMYVETETELESTSDVSMESEADSEMDSAVADTEMASEALSE